MVQKATSQMLTRNQHAMQYGATGKSGLSTYARGGLLGGPRHGGGIGCFLSRQSIHELVMPPPSHRQQTCK